MTSTPVTLRLKDDTIPPVTEAGSELKGLRNSILKEAERIYKGEKEHNSGKGGWSPMGTRVDSKGNTITAGTIYDPMNVTGARSKIIQGLLNDETRLKALQQGMDANGRYSGLNWVDRYIHKITDEDITKALHNRQIKLREDDTQFQDDLRELTPEQRAKVTSLTPVSEVRRLATDERQLDTLTETVRGMDLSPEGQALRDQLLKGKDGQRLSAEDLKALETTLKPYQRTDIRTVAEHDSKMDTARTSREVSTGTLDLNRKIEANNNAIRRSEIAYNNAKLKQDTEIANLKLKYEYDSANFDRELKRELALLGLDSQREDRQYRSERDQAQDRQMFILQLMRGLGGLGQSLGGY